MSSTRRAIWIVGFRAGSNLTARYLAACGAALPIAEPVGDEMAAWNPQWGEDRAVWALSHRVFGAEEKLHVPRQWRPPANHPGWGHVPALVAHFRDRATAPLTVFKFGCLPHVWPEIEAGMPGVEHCLVSCWRDREPQIASALRLHPDATRADVVDFVDRHDFARWELGQAFKAVGRVVVSQRLERAGLAKTARELGLEPTPEAEALWRRS